jgi:beta-glucanase (GH16 family)
MKLERLYFTLSIFLVLGSFLTLATIEGHDNAIQAAKVKAAGIVTPAGNKILVFSDDFNGTSLDASKWSTCYDWRLPSETGCTNQGNLEQEWYTRDQLTVGNGALILTAQKAPTDVVLQGQVKTFEYQSGMINTGSGGTSGNAHWAGTYGYYEARIKFGQGDGVWPAFWLLPVDKQWPPEIDIMEFIGGKPNQILQTVHWQQNGKPLENSKVVTGQNYSGGWHTYGVDWEPGRIDWYIDGVKTNSYIGSNVPDQPMEMILDLAIGGTLPKNADDSTSFPQEMQVDYVHVYQSKDQIRPNQY